MFIWLNDDSTRFDWTTTIEALVSHRTSAFLAVNWLMVCSLILLDTADDADASFDVCFVAGFAGASITIDGQSWSNLLPAMATRALAIIARVHIMRRRLNSRHKMK